MWGLFSFFLSGRAGVSFQPELGSGLRNKSQQLFQRKDTKHLDSVKKLQ